VCTILLRDFLQALAQLEEEFEPLLIGCQENRRNWQMMAEGRTREDDDSTTNRSSDDAKRL